MCSEELLTELEALNYAYVDEELTVTPASEKDKMTRITLRVLPRTGDDVHNRYTEALITLSPGPEYPAQPPTINVQSLGLGDSREAALLSLLRGEATKMTGELVLSHLCETAADFVSANNFPEGDCAFCLTSMHSQVVGKPQQQLLKLPACFHVFHQSCYVEWWGWQQQSFTKQERDMVRRTGSATAAALTAQLPSREATAFAKDRFFLVSCPACRLATPFSDLHHVQEDLRAAVVAAGVAPKGRGEAARVVVRHADQTRYASEQLLRSRAFSRQLAAGGIISPSNISIMGWSVASGAAARDMLSGGRDSPPPLGPEASNVSSSSSGTTPLPPLAQPQAQQQKQQRGPPAQGPQGAVGSTGKTAGRGAGALGGAAAGPAAGAGGAAPGAQGGRGDLLSFGKGQPRRREMSNDGLLTRSRVTRRDAEPAGEPSPLSGGGSPAL